MKEWQKQGFTLIGNISAALIIAGIVALVIEQKSVIEAVVLVVVGVYLSIYSVLHMKKIEEGDKK